MIYPLYEEGKLGLDDYLERTVFYEDRPFPLREFREFMLAQSEARPQMIELVRELKARYGLKVVAVSNEGLELAAHRIETFGLKGFIDLLVFSCFVRSRKPDVDIYHTALQLAQAPPQAVVYVEEQPIFVEVAKSLGIRAFPHLNDKYTRQTLATLGLSTEE